MKEFALNKILFLDLSRKATNIAQRWWRHAGFQKYFKNTGWLFVARITSFFTSFLTVAIVARYLGPENLGKLDYAQGFVAIISVFASLGIDQILYRDLITHPEKENELLGTAIFSKLFFGALAFILAITISHFLGDSLLLTGLVGICALTFLVNPIGTVGVLFNAQVKAKYSSQISIFLAFFIPALKILAIFLHRGLFYFAFIIFIEGLISALWSIYIYTVCFHNKPSSWKFRLDTFKLLLRDSWPLILAGFSGYVYAKIDQVLLLHMIDSATVGIYGVAVKLTQIWAFLPGMIIGSVFPAIVNAKKTDFPLYAKRFRALAGLTVGITALIALPLFIFAPLIIKIVFGEAFIDATPILRIYLWTSIAITLVVLVQHYFIAENFTRIFLYTSIIGATTNVLLNLILIPLFGSEGSAWGTMLSYMSVVLSLFLFKKSRDGIMRIFA
jgi:O-antigen/teichoic acid export membrane protein